jgi:hypothetical protein
VLYTVATAVVLSLRGGSRLAHHAQAPQQRAHHSRMPSAIDAGRLHLVDHPVEQLDVVSVEVDRAQPGILRAALRYVPASMPAPPWDARARK